MKMDGYPREVLEGVSPLLFAVDAVVNKETQSTLSEENISTGSKSSIFEAFYNSIASQQSINELTSGNESPVEQTKSRSFRYFRMTSALSPTETLRSSKKDFFSNAHIVPVSHRHAFPPSKDPHGNQNQNIQLNTKLYKAISTSLMKRSATTSAASGYDTILTHSNSLSPPKRSAINKILAKNPIQGILPSGWVEKHVHALPSTLLFVTELDINSSSSSSSSSKSKANVSTFSTSNATLYDQALLEQHLVETIENITSTVAKKRDVPIHLVVLVKVKNENDLNNNYPLQDGSDNATIQQERLISIKSVLHLNSNSITLLPYHIKPRFDNPINDNLEDESERLEKIDTVGTITYNKKQFTKLQQSIYENSNLYYLTQVRRFKRKYALLHHDKICDLMPLAIRYCIKIAIFYEFQCCSLDKSSVSSTNTSNNDTPYIEEEEEKIKREKSIRYWKEAYKHVIEYYTFLMESEVELRGNPGNNTDVRKRKKERSVDAMNNVRKVHRTYEENDSAKDSNNLEIQNEEIGERQHHTGENKSDLPPPPSDSTPIQNGVEVALVYSPKSGSGGVTIGAKTPLKTGEKDGVEDGKDSSTLATHSDDMIHQCRAVADWLNVKLLLLIKSSDDIMSSEVVLNLTNQVKKHSHVFLSKPLSLSRQTILGQCDDKNRHVIDPEWYFWQYVVHQNQVLSVLMDQYIDIPMIVLCTSFSIDVYHHLSPIKYHIAMGQSLLRLNLSIRNDSKDCVSSLKESQNMEHSMNDMSKGENRQRFVGSLAPSELSSVLIEETARNHFDLAHDCFAHAIQLLTNGAETLSSSEKIIPSISFARLHYFISGILMKQGKFGKAVESITKALEHSKKFPSLELLLEKALVVCYKRISSVNTTQTIFDPASSLILKSKKNDGLFDFLKFHLKDQSDMKLDRPIDLPFTSYGDEPFSFSLTFPQETYATEGGVVHAVLMLHSNLDLSVEVKDIKIVSNLGPVKINVMDSTTFIIDKGKSIQLRAKVIIPSDLSSAVDARLVQIQAISRDRPKICGLSQIGGGVYTTNSRQKKTLQGGLCIACKSVRIKFSALNILMNVDIHNAHRGSIPRPNSKFKETIRSSTEEDNYIYSSWNRPPCFKMLNGPRCLRIVCPQSDLEITDMTTKLTKGKLLEGVVNRIVMRIKSSPSVHCKNMKLSVICNSSIEKGSFKSLSLLDKEEVKNDTNHDPFSRRPVLVVCVDDISEQQDPNAPNGWKINQHNCGQGSRDDWIPIPPSSDSMTTFTSFDLYRPLPEYQDKEQDKCRTNFLVIISYNQIRPNCCDMDGDLVFEEYRGSVMWSSPIKAEIKCSSFEAKNLPSGNRHTANIVTTNDAGNDLSSIISGNEALFECSIEAPSAHSNLNINLKNIRFEPNIAEVEPNCSLELISSGRKNEVNDDTNLLYSPRSDSICRELNFGTKLSIAYTVRPCLKELNDKELKVTTRLGGISIEWTPVPLKLDSKILLSNTRLGFRDYHGPIPSSSQPMSLKLRGPLCHVDKTPFSASFTTYPIMPTIGTPFEIRYEITNKTSLHQKLRVIMNDSETSASSQNMLVSGTINGEISLGPLEIKNLSYVLLVTKVGDITIPTIDVSSIRYNSWVVHGSNRIFVSP